MSFFSRFSAPGATSRRGVFSNNIGPRVTTIPDFLTTSINVNLLRGVKVDRVLACCGSHWARPAGNSGADNTAEYASSVPVERLDDFVSHDWQTGAFAKFLTLCWIYNGKPAAWASLIVVAVVLLKGRPPRDPFSCPRQFVIAGEEYEVQPSQFVLILGLSVFWVFFFCWQRVKALLFPSLMRSVFVDHFCIDQTDDRKKKEGILALGGFVKQSDRLVMLWSNRYFSRLWCTFEVAIWQYLDRDLESTVLFMPVDWGIILSVATLVLSIEGIFVKNICGSQYIKYGIWLIMNIFIITVCQGLMKGLLRLPAQLDQFSIREAECFCCKSNHQHPVTKKRLPCDRKLIYATLVRFFEEQRQRDGADRVDSMELEAPWDASPDSPAESSSDTLELSDRVLMHRSTSDALDNFDQYVRTDVARAFAMKKGALVPFQVSYVQVLLVEMSWGIIRLETLFGLMETPDAGLEVTLRKALFVGTLYFAVFPVFFFVFMALIPMAMRFGFGNRSVGNNRSVGFSQRQGIPYHANANWSAGLNVVLMVLIGCCMLATNEILWWSTYFTAGLVNPVPQVVVSLGLGIVVAKCYRSCA